MIALAALTLAPSAAATWTTSASVPASFRPDRDVMFTYTAQSSSAADIPVQWRVSLFTCQDQNANGWCDFSDLRRVDHADRTLNAVGGQSASVSWTVHLDQPEGTYRYHFHAACLNNPCTGTPGGGAHNKTGTFQLAYTNTWTRAIIATTPTSVGSTQTIQYRLQSSSPDDRDLDGKATLFSTPAGAPEREHGSQTVSVAANGQQTISWPNVDFPTIGTQRLRVEDTTGPETTMDVIVRGVHLHAHQPRATYPAGARIGLYFTLEGHGSTPEPAPIPNTDVRVSIRNGSFVVSSATLRTDANGLAYANLTTAHDARTLAWTASASGTWLGIAYDLAASGVVELVGDSHAAIEENLTQVRDDLDDIRLRGVHLDEIGSRNAWMTSVRAAGAVALVVLLILLVVFISFRV